MKLDEIVAWYQKKIGLYDKQQWEQTVEQRILNGFSQVPLKNTKLKTELIDVDLVRGSTFPKAKPKQKLLTVLRLAILRYFFIPLYAKWWSEQTSPKVFGVLLFLYLLQMFNWAVYSYNVNRIGVDVEHIVSISELIIPMLLSLILCVIHSQIVATSSSSSSSSNGTSKNSINSIDKINKINNLQTKRKKRERIRRKKKNPRGRTPNSLNDSKTSNLNTTTTTDNYTDTPDNKLNDDVNLIDLNKDKKNKENLNEKNDLDINHHQLTEQSTTTLRKRNVIWDSPIRSQVILSKNDHYVYRIDDETGNYIKYNTMTEIDQQKFIHMSKTAQDFYNEICNRSLNNDNTLKNIDIKVDDFDDEIDEDNEKENNNHNVQEQTGEDDGFESLNGKSSSGEDTNIEQRNYEILEQINISSNHNLQHMQSQHQQQPQQQQFNKTSRNTWIKDTHESNNNNNRNSDSDTDTLSGLNSNINLISRKQPITSVNTIQNVKLLFNKQQLQQQQQQQQNKRLPLSSESDMDVNSQRMTNKLSTILKHTTTQSGLGTINNQLINKKLLKIKNNDTSDTDDENNDDDDEEEMCGNNYNIKKTSHNNNNSTNNDGIDDDCVTISSNVNGLKQQNNHQQQLITDVSTSTTEWIGVTTNSEECSYSSEIDQTDSQNDISDNNPNNNGYEFDYTPTVILNPTCGANDRISCTIWDHRETKKAELSVLDISSAIIERVEAMPETCDYIYIGCSLSVILSFIPVICRLCEVTVDTTNSNDTSFFHIPSILWEKAAFSSFTILCFAFGDTHWERLILIISFLQRLCLTFLFFFLLAVAERTFKQRFLYAKLFSHLTSSRRAKKSELPHFRLNKVRNIKTWLSVRSYLKRRGPQRSVDVIVSAAFLVTLLLLAFLSVEYIKDSVHVHSLFNLEALLWSCSLGAFLLRFMTLGTKINRKYRSISVLITEQINLYLQIEQKPQKKEELMVANSVLKLAADLLKELESPFKISGLSANPYLYTTIKVVILSALSGVLSEMLGFKLKLHKIKIK